jgi:TolB-like protein/thioredoxin-like negative regulator of GroEL
LGHALAKLRANHPAFRTLIIEINQRNVLQFAVIYLIAGWAITKGAGMIFSALDLPAWTVTLVVGLLIAGFVLSVVLAWNPDAGRVTGRHDRRPRGQSAGLSEHGLPDDKSIGILPFADKSESGDQGYLADGLTEETLSGLERTDDLRVASRTACFALKDKKMDVRSIGGHLRVAYVLKGSVRRTEDSIDIAVWLLEAATDSLVWSQAYERDIDDIFIIKDDIVARIAIALQASLPQGALQGATTADPEAYDAYLRGRSHYRRHGLTDLAHAVTMFTQAIEIDPSFTRAWVDLALTYSQQVIYFEGGEAEQASAYEAAERAVALAPDRADSHTALGIAHVASENYAEAVTELNRAIELDPTLWDALYFLGRVAVHEGDIRRAIDFFERAAAVNPDDFESPALAAGLGKGLVDEAVQQRLAEQAVERVERLVKDHPDNSRALYLGAGALLTLGEEEQARSWAARALEVDPNDPAIRYNLGCFYARAGDADKAFECLEGSIRSRSWIENDADLDSLREDPRYRRLLERLEKI